MLVSTHEARTTRIRLPIDHIPGQPTLVYKYLTHDFRDLLEQGIDIAAKKTILKAVLQGLAELHAENIVHLDLKPDNILLDHSRASQSTSIQSIQISDLENVAYLPQDRLIKGMVPGHDSWRSPGGHLRGILNIPHDMFCFGIMLCAFKNRREISTLTLQCIYAILGRMIFDIDDDFQEHIAQGAIHDLIHLQRQVTYFGDEDGLKGLMKHVQDDDDVGCYVLQVLWGDRSAEHHEYTPFSTWPEVEMLDAGFKDLIHRMMDLDPARRITAVEALIHPWFADVLTPARWEASCPP